MLKLPDDLELSMMNAAVFPLRNAAPYSLISFFFLLLLSRLEFLPKHFFESFNTTLFLGDVKLGNLAADLHNACLDIRYKKDSFGIRHGLVIGKLPDVAKSKVGLIQTTVVGQFD